MYYHIHFESAIRVRAKDEESAKREALKRIKACGYPIIYPIDIRKIGEDRYCMNFRSIFEANTTSTSKAMDKFKYLFPSATLYYYHIILVE